MREELVPEEVGEGIGDHSEDGKDVSFKILDGTFRNIAVIDIWQDKLEIAVPIINDSTVILGASFIVKDLEINAVALGSEAQNYAVVGSNSMPVVA